MTISWVNPILKKPSTWIALIILISLGLNILLIQRNCKTDEDLQDEIDKVEAGDKLLAFKNEAYDALKGDTEDKINELNGMIDSSITVIETIRGIDEEKAARIRELEARTFPDDSDKDEQIDHWKERSELWEGRFLLSQQAIEEKDTQIFLLSEKYDSEVILRLEAEELKDDYSTQYYDAMVLVKDLARRLSMKSTANLLWKGAAGVGWLLAVVKGK